MDSLAYDDRSGFSTNMLKFKSEPVVTAEVKMLQKCLQNVRYRGFGHTKTWHLDFYGYKGYCLIMEGVDWVTKGNEEGID